MIYLSLPLLLTGAIIILICCLKCNHLNKNFIIFKDYNPSYVFNSLFNIFLLIFFFISYIAFAVLTFIKYFSPDVSILVACILFMVAVFVFVNTKLQTKMHRIINKAHLETIRCLVNSVEARDFYTKGHSEHVSNLVALLYHNLPKAYKKKINYNSLKTAGLLHDIGKIGVPENILNKQDTLTPLEWTYIQKHPLIGKKILCSSDHLNQISEWIYYHHERIDGNGYYGIRNEDIPIESKILAIADTYSALVTMRPYRAAMSHQSAIKVLNDAAGTQLDAYLVGVFCYISEHKILKCNPIDVAVAKVI